MSTNNNDKTTASGLIKNHIAASILNSIGFIANIVSIGGLIYNSNRNEYGVPFFIFLNIFIVSALAIIIGWVAYFKIIRVLRDRTKTIENIDDITNFIHQEIILIIRDAYCGYKEKSPVAKPNRLLKDLVAAFSKKISHLYGKDINVCIKQIHRVEGDEDAMNWMVKTVARYCKKHLNSRRKNDKIPISIIGNTDFKNIMCGESFFACGDLLKLQQGGDFDNTNPSWASYYNSTMVLPIRGVIHGEDINTDEIYDIIGFLCLDCKDSCPEWERENNYIFNMSATFADVLYILMNESLEFTEKCKESKEMYSCF